MIVSIGDVKRQLGIDRVDDDSRIFSAIKSAEDEARRYCSRQFDYGTYIEYFSGDGATKVFFVDEPPIVSITGIYVDCDREFASDTLIDSDDYAIESDIGMIEFDYPISEGVYNIKIEYVGGYLDFPEDLKEAIKKLAAYIYIQNGGSLLSFEKKEDVEALKDRAYLLLDRYKVELLA